MKHRLHNANKNAGPDFPGGADEIVMDSPLYPRRRFSPLLAQFAASFEKAATRTASRRGSRKGEFQTENLRAKEISTLKCRQSLPIQSRRETVAGYRKQLGRINRQTPI
jgi:hypothetical protein